jgi:hypothetical protein
VGRWASIGYGGAAKSEDEAAPPLDARPQSHCRIEPDGAQRGGPWAASCFQQHHSFYRKGALATRPARAHFDVTKYLFRHLFGVMALLGSASEDNLWVPKVYDMRTDSAPLLKTLAAALALLFFMPLGTVAGVITFFDLTDNVTFTGTPDTSGRASGSCGEGESCTLTLLAPAGATSGKFDQCCGIGFDIVDPGSTTLSDSFAGTTIFNTQNPPFASIVFTSDTEGMSLGSCASGFCFSENGTVQFDLQIDWTLSSGASALDDIEFQSDVEPAPVPEPSSTLLTLTGSVVLSLARYRRRDRFSLNAGSVRKSKGFRTPTRWPWSAERRSRSRRAHLAEQHD